MIELRAVLLVGAGGFLGSVGRYLAAALLPASWPGQLPLATLAVNVVGSALIGLLAGYGVHRPGEGAWLFLATGLLGGFTTFSAFSLETILLARGGSLALAVANAAAHLLLGLAAAWLGYAAVRP